MTTTEEVIRRVREVADTVCNEIGPVAMCKDPLYFAQEVGVRLIKLVKAEENEACAKVCENLAMQQDYDVRDECAAAIRARGTHD
mgnify:CR=1 FL=1